MNRLAPLIIFTYNRYDEIVVTIRQAHERPEGMDETTVIMSGLNKTRVIDAVEVVTAHNSQDIRAIKPVKPTMSLRRFYESSCRMLIMSIELFGINKVLFYFKIVVDPSRHYKLLISGYYE